MDVDCFSLVTKVIKAGDHPVRFRLVVIVPHLCRSNHDLRPFFGLLTPQILIPSEHFNTRNQGIYIHVLPPISAVFIFGCISSCSRQGTRHARSHDNAWCTHVMGTTGTRRQMVRSQLSSFGSPVFWLINICHWLDK